MLLLGSLGMDLSILMAIALELMHSLRDFSVVGRVGADVVSEVPLRSD